MKTHEIYICSGEGDLKCNCLVEVLNDCEVSAPSCCGIPMKLIEEKTADQGKEKHVPVIIPVDGGYEVRVGDVPHPMLEKHYINFIELFTTDAIYRKFLKPDEDPVAFFATNDDAIGARAYCNIHGLWKS